MLARVLLHVVEAPAPIDAAPHLCRQRRLIEDVDDPAGRILLHPFHPRSAQRSGIARLTSGLRIESGLIQDRGRLSVPP